MKTLRELEKQLDDIENRSESSMLYMTLDDGRHVKLNCGSQDGLLQIMTAAIKNEDHPYRNYIKHAVAGVPDQGVFVLTCRAIMESFERLEAERV